jgi:hypothetical protein
MTRLVRSLVVVGILWLASPPPRAAVRWEPIPAELAAIEDCAAEPGCPAAILLSEALLDNEGPHTRLSHHVIIRIFKPEGLDAATIKLPFVVGASSIRDLRGRSVSPDGSQVELDPASVIEETVVRRRGYWRKRLSFEIPGARAGGLLEYAFSRNYEYSVGYLDWWVQDSLPILRASISIVPGPGSLGPRLVRLGGITKDEDAAGRPRYNLTDIPSFVDEPLMPPEDAVRGRLVLYPGDPWWSYQTLGAEHFEEVTRFFRRSSRAKKLAREIVGEAGDPQAALERIYAWIQDNLDNTSYQESAEGEVAGEKNLYVDDVLDRGQGTDADLARLFVFLVQQAGLEAAPALVSTREDDFFRPDTFVPSDLDGELAVVLLNGDWRFFDPGTRYCPSNVVAWQNQGVDLNAIVARKGGGFLRRVPAGLGDDNLLRRETTITLAGDGGMRAEASLEAHGLAGAELRNALDHRTDADRVAYFDEDLEGAFPGVTVEALEVTNLPRWSEPLRLRLAFTVPGWAKGAGSRLLVPAAPFQAGRSNPLVADRRRNPVYFLRTHRVKDETIVRIPEGYVVESLPNRRTKDAGALRYEAQFAERDGAVRCSRDWKVDVLLVEPNLYDVVRDVYGAAFRVDGSQIVLRRADAAPAGS